MKPKAVIAVLVSLAFLPAALAGGKQITLDQVTGQSKDKISFRGKLKPVSWGPEKKLLKIGSGKEAKWLDPATLEEVPAPKGSDASKKTREAIEKAFAALPGFDKKIAKKAAKTRSKKGEAGHLIKFQGDLFFFDKKTEKIRRLTSTNENERLEQISKDGRFVTYIRGNHLILQDTDGGKERQIDKDGSKELLYGHLDWVYQEEIYGRYNFQGTFWSPSSQAIAFLRLKEHEVPKFPVVDHIPYHTKMEIMRYPKAGDPNPEVALGAANVLGGGIKWINLSRYDDEILIVNVGWNPAGDRVIFQVQDREQTWLDLNEANPKNGKVKTLLRETSKTWVNVMGGPRWLKDGSFLWYSERTGNKHLYHYAADGTLKNKITWGDWDVRSIARLDEEKGLIWFTGKKDGAINSNLYRVKMDGSGLTRLTKGDGTHRTNFSKDGTFFTDRFESLEQPPAMRLCRADGEIVKTLAESEIPDLEKYGYLKRELLEVPARDGFMMDATILRPANFDESKTYPVWLMTYSGPNAPSVRNSWNSSAWHQFLAQQGFIVFQVNNRTSSGKGQATTEKCYLQFGVQELADLVDAVDWLIKHPWADASRVGITGWSFGGTMTAYALTHSKKFALGIAGAGVYDWRDYDTIYTERYMRTPQNNPTGYQKTSVVRAAKNLHGHLLLVHGTIDDNVHFQNAVQFVYALQKAGKQFDLMIYPKSKHRIGSKEQRWHLKELEWKTIQKHLGGGKMTLETSGSYGQPGDTR